MQTSVFVGRNDVKPMLHEAGQLAEFGNVSSQKSTRCIIRRTRPASPLCDRIILNISWPWRIDKTGNPSEASPNRSVRWAQIQGGSA
jgi:hypothetical protein